MTMEASSWEKPVELSAQMRCLTSTGKKHASFDGPATRERVRRPRRWGGRSSQTFERGAAAGCPAKCYWGLPGRDYLMLERSHGMSTALHYHRPRSGIPKLGEAPSPLDVS